MRYLRHLSLLCVLMWTISGRILLAQDLEDVPGIEKLIEDLERKTAKTKSNLPELLESFRKPVDVEEASSVLDVLFRFAWYWDEEGRTSEAANGPGAVGQMLIERRLRYEHWESREVAIVHFSQRLAAEPEKLHVILSDALNDTNSNVRRTAVELLGQNARALKHGPISLMRVKLDSPAEEARKANARRRIRDNLEFHLDRIAELLIETSATDECEEVADWAVRVLLSDTIPPTPERLKALSRRLEMGTSHKIQAEDLAELRRTWHSALQRPIGNKELKPAESQSESCPFR